MAIDEVRQRERYCLGCRYPLGAVAAAGAGGAGRRDDVFPAYACPECGRRFDPEDERTTLATPRSLHWEHAAEVVRGGTFCAGLLAAVSIGASFFWALPAIMWLLGVLAAIPLAMLSLSVMAPWIPIAPRTRVAALLSVTLFVSVVLTAWPFQLSFVMHRAALERYVAGVRAGTVPADSGAVRIGVMYFIDVRLLTDGTVGLQLTGDRGGGALLVKGMPGVRTVWFNKNWERHFGGEWWLVWED